MALLDSATLYLLAENVRVSYVCECLWSSYLLSLKCFSHKIVQIAWFHPELASFFTEVSDRGSEEVVTLQVIF